MSHIPTIRLARLESSLLEAKSFSGKLGACETRGLGTVAPFPPAHGVPGAKTLHAACRFDADKTSATPVAIKAALVLNVFPVLIEFPFPTAGVPFSASNVPADVGTIVCATPKKWQYT